jgi:prepilin-type N-terminal cleavage/methylation domain-containing protein
LEREEVIMKLAAFQRRLRARRTGSDDGFTLPEMLVVVSITGIIVVVLASALIVGAQTTTQATKRLNESHDAQMVNAYFVTDVQSSSYFSKTVTPSGAACSVVGSPVAMFQWTEVGVTKDAFYSVQNGPFFGVQNGSPTQLVRRYCDSSGAQYDVSLVKHLSGIPVVECPAEVTYPVCSTTPADVQLKVTETSAYDYTLRAAPRHSGAGGVTPGLAIYVGGGGLELGGNSTLNVPSGVVVVAGGPTICNGSDSVVQAPDGFFATTSGQCSPTPGEALPDPLLDLPTPDPSLLPVRIDSYHPDGNDCGTIQPTYQPGRYANASTLSDGCLASGVYYFENLDAGTITLDNVKSAPNGVHIYVDQASSQSGQNTLTLSGNVNLAPMTSGPDALVTVFLGRSNAGAIGVTHTMTVSGAIYAPAGSLEMQSNGANLTTGSINVYRLFLQGNGSGVIVI